MCATGTIGSAIFRCWVDIISIVHHFKGKEDLALAAIEHWDVASGGVFASASYRSLPDPLDRLLGYVDGTVSGVAVQTAHRTEKRQ